MMSSEWGDLTELLDPAHHPWASTTDQIGRTSIGGCAGGVLHTGHTLVQVGHQGRHTERTGDRQLTRL